VLDTRKTLPGWRRLAKYAVAVGGGRNHRHGLYDQVLIKDNHLASGLSPAEAVEQARRAAPRGMRVEVEVESLADARAAAEAGADIIMLDNMSPARMRRAVAAIRAVAPEAVIEASGAVTLRRLRAIAETGVNWISVGALTHSAPALDISLDTEPR
jgi:nicotinate-nucleotide pyrophosphorylase (carboxylating)